MPGSRLPRPHRRRRGWCSALVGLGVLGVLSTTLAAAPATAATGPLAAGKTPTTTLMAGTFTDPPLAVRPTYRFWVPLARTEDEVLKKQLQDVKDVGGGGVELVPFIVPGAGNQSNAFLKEYGFGTPRWAHTVEVVTAAAAKLGLSVDLNLGPHYPPTVPTLNSFNQPEAEQQLIYGREFAEAGSTRRGPLPSPTTAPPSVTTKLCADASAGSKTLGVESLGGLAAGDVVTLGTGAAAEKLTVKDLGDRTAACGQLTVSPLTKAHASGDSVQDTARTTRIRTVVAQCAQACSATTTATVTLEPSSIVDVSKRVSKGELTFSFPKGNGNPWVVIDFLQTASGLTGQRNGFTATQPNYVVDHWDHDGVDIQADFWDKNILTRKVRANLRDIGTGAVFEDSLELGTTQKWTWDFAKEFTERRGYDIARVLPALAGAGIQGTGTPAFELAGIGPKAREDYRQTLSDLYIDEYVKPMQKWAGSHGLDFRAQAYGMPISTPEASAAVGIPEGESLNFGPPNEVGAEQSYRAVSAGAHLSGKNIVSVECCANFFGNYRSSVAGPNVGGGYTAGGDGSQVGGKYSQGNLDSVYKAYGGGVNQLVWHGLPYRDAPGGGTTGGQGGNWPGYNPWDIFNALNASESFGPRQASWDDYRTVNDNLARTQLVLRQGRATVDLGVYYEDLGLAGESVSPQQTPQHMLGNDSATAQNGYTYEYVAPAFLNDRRLRVERDGGLFGNTSDHQALILNDQRTMTAQNADRLLNLARDGLKMFVVGEVPQSTTGAASQDKALQRTIAALLKQKTVTTVASEAGLPAALQRAGIDPTVTPEKPTSALGLVHREAKGISYDYIYNRSAEPFTQKLTLTGKGRPYLLNTWTGRIEPVTQYERKGGRVSVDIRVAPYDKVVIALDERGNADPAKATTRVADAADKLPLNEWTLKAQTWAPGENQYTTVKKNQEPFTLTAGADGKLPSWLEITSPLDLSRASGVGEYTTTVSLPSTWSTSDGAYLGIGDALDTVKVSVNGKAVVVNQSDRERIDLGKLLRPGKNTITVTVSTTLFNAVRSTGDVNYQSPAWQRTGLMGPVTLQPYRDTPVP